MSYQQKLEADRQQIALRTKQYEEEWKQYEEQRKQCEEQRKQCEEQRKHCAKLLPKRQQHSANASVRRSSDLVLTYR
ncbi:hypothetical protein AAVH_20260 [Aphelenchoides avenae]|nr:hypothetical protein AAVH_20260 [Aphelenchus avenae]